MGFLLSLTTLVSLATVAPAEHHKAQLAPSTLYAAGGWGSGGNTLYLMDRTTGALTRVGDFGTTDPIPYIAYDRKTDKFYSITAYGRYLYSIDRHTGQASYVGPTGLWKTYALTFSPSDD